jgi:hypothetical protein
MQAKLLIGHADINYPEGIACTSSLDVDMNT